jgi:hypothetical protein
MINALLARNYYCDFTVDEGFKNLLPPLLPEDFDELEKSIVKDGCRDPLVVWKEKRVLVDGYNRYRICKKHDLSFAFSEKSFVDRDAAIIWMLANQKSRRNMNRFQWAEIALKLKDGISERAKENQRGGVRLESNRRVDTLQKLADLAGVTRDAM